MISELYTQLRHPIAVKTWNTREDSERIASYTLLQVGIVLLNHKFLHQVSQCYSHLELMLLQINFLSMVDYCYTHVYIHLERTTNESCREGKRRFENRPAHVYYQGERTDTESSSD